MFSEETISENTNVNRFDGISEHTPPNGMTFAIAIEGKDRRPVFENIPYQRVNG